jgi:hypothetical protein
MKRSVSACSMIAMVVACGNSGAGSDDWTKAKTETYVATIEGVTVSLELPEGRIGKPGDKDSGWDYWFMHELGYGPSVAIDVRDEQNVFDPAWDAPGHLRAEKLANGHAYVESRSGAHDYSAHLVVQLEHGKWLYCRASGGVDESDADRERRLPALEKLCRTLAIGGKPVAVASDSATPSTDGASAAAALPAECTAYIALMTRLAACDKVEQSKRDGLLFAAQRAPGAWATLPPVRAAALGADCKAGSDGLAADAAACGL